jgi:hypothetical protein
LLWRCFLFLLEGCFGAFKVADRPDSVYFCSETQLLSDLNLVHEGMLSRQAQLERRSTQLTEEELIDQLRSKLKASETKLGDLLGALIRTSNDLFADDDATLRPQLRSFLDVSVLLNLISCVACSLILAFSSFRHS